MTMSTHEINEDHLLYRIFKMWQQSGDTEFFGEWFNKLFKNNKVLGYKR